MQINYLIFDPFLRNLVIKNDIFYPKTCCIFSYYFCMSFIIALVRKLVMFNALVSLDGSGDFISIGAIIAAAPKIIASDVLHLCETMNI